MGTNWFHSVFEFWIINFWKCKIKIKTTVLFHKELNVYNLIFEVFEANKNLCSRQTTTVNKNPQILQLLRFPQNLNSSNLRVKKKKHNKTRIMAKGVKSFYLFLICIYNKGDTGKKRLTSWWKLKQNKK